MPSTVYKGDLSEITFGHEAGITLEHDYAGSSFLFRAGSTDRDLVRDTSKISFRNGIANTPVLAGILRYPNGMLVGSKVVFSINSTSPNWSTDDDYAVSGRSYTIIKQEVATSGDNDGFTEITITPALRTDHDSGDVDSKFEDAGDVMRILPFTTPTIDVGMAHADAANASVERVLTDQFIGLVSTVALPETKVDLKRFHVVGLGRDVAVQVPGRFTNTGGTFECNIHNGRWFYYCLGQEVVKPHSSTPQTGGYTYSLAGAVNSGDSFLKFDGNSSWPTINSVPIAVGDYIVLDSSTTMVDVQTYRDTAVGGGLAADAWPNVDANQIFDKALKTEVRRIVGINKEGTTNVDTIFHIWLDDPLLYGHVDNLVVKFAKYQTAATYGSPNRDNTTGGLTQPVEHLFFSRSTVPSFSMEVSVRRNDNDGNTQDVVDGGASDTKQLTRVYRGCKVKDWSLTVDTDAALRLTTNFDSALCFTDTGRLEGTNPGDRYDAHRLFEDTANTEVKRKESGIEKGTQKPFMFYNGTINMLNTQLGQVVSFTLNGKTGVEQYYTINGANIADSATDQVPFAGTRNPALAVEGKTEFDMEMEIIVDDPLFYHNMRRSVANFDDTDEAGQTDTDMIRLSFVKQGTGTDRESIDILMDDFFITEAPMPVPEDKGPMRSKLKILPKTVKVIAKDTVLHA